MEQLWSIMTRYAPTAVATMLLGAVVHRFWSWYRLSHINGPFWWTISDLPLIRKTWEGTLHHTLADFVEEHGLLVRIAPNYIVCSDPMEVRRIWGVRSSFERTDWYKGFQFDPPRDNAVSQRDYPSHITLRSKIAPGYSGKGIDGLHESIDGQVAKLVQLIEAKYLSTDHHFQPVDITRLSQYVTLDVISEIAFGEAFGFLDKDEDLFEYIKTTEKSLPFMQMVALLPWLMTVLQSRFLKPFLPSEKDLVGLGKIMGLAKHVVAQRFGLNKIQRRDMLGSFIEHGLAQKEAENESLLQIVAGSETTASAFRSILLHVMTSPGVYSQLQAKIDEGVRKGLISSPVTDAEARNLPFLQACIKEGLRLIPPINSIMPKVSKHDALIAGVKVPAGTSVGWSAKACLRNKDVFGHDAELYWPQRWLTASPEKLKDMDCCVDLVFGQGKWGCLGKPIALIEVNKLIIELLRRFDFTITNPTQPLKSLFYGAAIHSDFYGRVSRRKCAV